MENIKTDDTRYIINGYKDRKEYLNSLIDDNGYDSEMVYAIAEMLGPTEDFDGLVSELEDFHNFNIL